MKKIIFFIIIWLIPGLLLLRAQTIVNSNLKTYQKIHQENIFLHHNASLLFIGEYIYYKVYNLNAEDNHLSSISKVAYVELVGADKQLVFKHKIKLTSGVGQGDFLIPNTVLSGNYKLIAYTIWMKNGVRNNYFQEDISIINPYRKNQNKMLVEVINDTILGLDNTQVEIDLKIPDKKRDEYFDLNINGEKFKKRTQVLLNLKSLKGTEAYGNYSISVRKIAAITNPSKFTAETFTDFYKDKNDHRLNIESKNIYLPELRGDIISGRLVSIITNLPVENEKVVISIPRKDFIIKVATTNENGVFYFNINENYYVTNALIQVLGENKEQYKIILDKHISVGYSDILFNKLIITPDMSEAILERSIYNQIENAYFDIRPNTVQPVETISPFYGSPDIVYNLDDYTRFSTVRVTLIEIIKNLWVKKSKDDKYIFQLRGSDNYTDYIFTPWIIVDGVLLQNHNEIIEYNAKKIKKISLLRNRYIYGSQDINGIVVFETIDGNFYETMDRDHINKIELFSPLPQKNYINQTYTKYTKEKTDRIPDFRNQLFWKPDISLSMKEMNFYFFTSDNIGIYEICLEGFTMTGEPVSIRKVITVE